MPMATHRCIWPVTTVRTLWSGSSSKQEPMSTRCESIILCQMRFAWKLHAFTLIALFGTLLQVNERGFSALHFASSSRQGALCQELLLAHGARINLQVGRYAIILRPNNDMIFKQQIVCVQTVGFGKKKRSSYQSLFCSVFSRKLKMTVLLTFWWQ